MVYKISEELTEQAKAIVFCRCRFCQDGFCIALSKLENNACIQMNSPKMISCPMAMRAIMSEIKYYDLFFRMMEYNRNAQIVPFTDKVKYLRQYRNMTQKELGLKIGFAERSAGVRIAQYESGTRFPKQDKIDKIADALNFQSAVFQIPFFDDVKILLEQIPKWEELLGKDFKLLTSVKNKTAKTIYDWLSFYLKYLEDSYSNEDYEKWIYTITHY